MKVLHVAESISKNSGGVGAVINHLHQGLRKKGIESNIATRDAKSDMSLSNNLNDKQKEEYFHIHNNLEQLLKKINPELIHIHGLWNTYCKPCMKFSHENKVKIILSPHGMAHPWALSRSKMKKKIYKFFVLNDVLKNLDGMHALTNEESQCIKYFTNAATKVYIVPNPTDTHNKDIFLKNRKNIIFMGRIAEQKGINKILDLWSEMFRENQCLGNTLNIYGDGEGLYFKKFKQKLKTTPNTNYHGPVYGDEKISVLNHSKAIIMMSEFEGLPMMALEAMSYGIPVICNYNCGLNHEIEKNLVFVLKEKENRVTQLKKILIQLEDYSIQDAKKLISHTEKYYSNEKVIDGMINLYKKVLNEDIQKNI
tara:strand:+ start:3509 stop:4609 length:1101 start_codon:yes stop_codon:yes gene_type:complete